MTIREFLVLSQEEQAEHLYNEGVYIGKLHRNEKRTMLFQFHSFYVEVVYEEYRRDISHLKCYAGPCELNEYIEQVSLGEIAFTLTLN